MFKKKHRSVAATPHASTRHRTRERVDTVDGTHAHARADARTMDAVRAPSDAMGDGSDARGRERRARKAVETFVVDVAPARASKIEIGRGKGTKLSEIPNVAFRLSKISRKEDILKFIYRVLYKGTPRQLTVKRDIGEFSGWTFESDGERAVKEDLLMRAYKETLHEILDLFEVPRGSGAEAKKE